MHNRRGGELMVQKRSTRWVFLAGTKWTNWHEHLLIYKWSKCDK